MAPEQEGRWGEPFKLNNVAVHVNLLPSGKVLYWGRRENPNVAPTPQNMDEHKTRAFVWDPASKPGTPSIPTANNPLDMGGDEVNLFCSGHAFLPDGTLLIAGGHLTDGRGSNQACIYDPDTNKFHPKFPMNMGRWYPSVIALPDGRALVASGSFEGYHPNNIPQIWPYATGRENLHETPDDNLRAWIEATDPVAQWSLREGDVTPLYPRLHVAPWGSILAVGPQPRSWWFDLKDKDGNDISPNKNKVVGTWTNSGPKGDRLEGYRDYCPSIMYAPGKIMYIGGGLTGDRPEEPARPSNVVEFVDISKNSEKQPFEWTQMATSNMEFQRRQFNATILPDGSVLVTGGTNGSTFNDVEKPVRIPELWTPESNKWTKMAIEGFPRLYHGTALLLPSGQVLSAGGGEYLTDLKNCLTNAQLYNPPYLCKSGPRPAILNFPHVIVYGETFNIKIGTDPVSTSIPTLRGPTNGVSWIRLGSVTHCRNMSQSFTFLASTQNGANVSVAAPANSNISPPGHYMLFVLDQRGVPSVGRIIRIAPTLSPLPSPTKHKIVNPRVPPAPNSTPTLHKLSARTSAAPIPPPTIQPTLEEHSAQLAASQNRPPIVVGLTPLCPYGLGPCWGGAFDALRRISDVDVVAPIPSQADSLAFVYPHKRDLIPDIDVWRKELTQTINGSYDMRGIEMKLEGEVGKKGEEVVLAVAGAQELVLAPFTQGSQVKWDIERSAPKPVTGVEIGAYKRLVEGLKSKLGGGKVKVRATGTLQKKGAGKFALDVREFEFLDVALS